MNFMHLIVETLHWGKVARAKFATYLYLVLRLKMSGVISLLRFMPGHVHRQLELRFYVFVALKYHVHDCFI